MSKSFRREVDRFERQARLAGARQQTNRRRERVRSSWERPETNKWDASGMNGIGVDIERDTHGIRS